MLKSHLVYHNDGNELKINLWINATANSNTKIKGSSQINLEDPQASIFTKD